MLLSWLRFRDTVESADAMGPRRRPIQRTSAQTSRPREQATSTFTGVWRVLASNNRELGRSSRTYSSSNSAKDHVRLLQESIDELVVTPVVGPQPGLYGWLLEHEGTPVITCGRWYAASSSKETVVSTVSALRSAVITEAPRALHDPQRRSTGRRLSREAVAPW